MAQEDELIFAMSVMEKPSALIQRKPAVVAAPKNLSNENHLVVSIKPVDESAAVDVPKPQRIKLETPDFVDADMPPKAKPPVSASVNCTNVKRSTSADSTNGKLSSSANSIFTEARPVIRTVGFDAPPATSSTPTLTTSKR